MNKKNQSEIWEENIQKVFEVIAYFKSNLLLKAYLQSFENSTWNVLNDIEMVDSPTYTEFKNWFNNWLFNAKKLYKRLNVKITQKQIAHVHILKQNLKISNKQYYQILNQKFNVKSSKQLVFYTYKLFEQSLNKVA